MQNIPVVLAVSQSTMPHAQADGLAAEPSDIEQTAGGLLLHVSVAETQYMPVVLAVSQSTVPHAQVDGLAAEPSVMAQTGPLRHLFWDR